jgi:hypothetical protein
MGPQGATCAGISASRPEARDRRGARRPVRRYPALIDRQSSVDLELLESAAAAAPATRRGVERLLRLAVHKPLLALAKRVPRAASRAAMACRCRARRRMPFARPCSARAVRDAFGLGPAALPRTEARLRGAVRGRRAAPGGGVRAPGARVRERRAELGQTRARPARAPLPSRAARRRRATSARSSTSSSRRICWRASRSSSWSSFPRYLRAAQLRFGRAILDPRRDADKLESFASLWKRSRQARHGARLRGPCSRALALRRAARSRSSRPSSTPLRGVSVASLTPRRRGHCSAR